jgi:hypothetical protein
MERVYSSEMLFPIYKCRRHHKQEPHCQLYALVPILNQTIPVYTSPTLFRQNRLKHYLRTNTYVFQAISFLESIRQKLCMHISSLPYTPDIVNVLSESEAQCNIS